MEKEKDVKCELTELREVVRKSTRNEGKIGAYTEVNGQYTQSKVRNEQDRNIKWINS